MLALVILAILFMWLVCAAVCTGIGSLVLRLLCAASSLPHSTFGRSGVQTFTRSNVQTFQRSSFSPLDAFWTGVALICALLQLYHFFRPIDLAAVFLLVALALAGWIWNRAMLFQRLAISTSQPLNVLLFSIGAAIIAFRAAGPCEHYDTGLYGAAAIRWFTTYPLVPGLGNFIGQLGFNSSVFLWMAALDQGPWRGLSHHLFIPFLILALLASILPAAVRVFRALQPSPLVFRGLQLSPLDWFQTILFIPAAIWAATGKIVGANTDLATTVVCLGAATMAFRALHAPAPFSPQESVGTPSHEESSRSSLQEKVELPRGNDTQRMSLVVAMMLFSLAVTFKVSSMVFGFLGWIVVLVKLWSLSRTTGRTTSGTTSGTASRTTPQGKWLVSGAVLLSAAIILPWIGRGLVLTGYPLFPSTVLSIPVDWRGPAPDAQWQADFARSFARVPELTAAYAHGWHWLKPWFRYMVLEREGFVIPLFFAFAGALVAIFRRARRSEEAAPQWLWLLLPGLAGMLFWFLEAPSVRFGELALWTTAATLGGLAALRVLDTPARRRVGVVGLLLLTGWAAHPRLLWGSYFRPSIGVRAFLHLPEARVLPQRTTSGLIIFVPDKGNQCWDAPLPCAPEFNRGIRLREPGNLKRGFAPAGAKSDVTVPGALP
jgi:hypothetical protein